MCGGNGGGSDWGGNGGGDGGGSGGGGDGGNGGGGGGGGGGDGGINFRPPRKKNGQSTTTDTAPVHSHRVVPRIVPFLSLLKLSPAMAYLLARTKLFEKVNIDQGGCTDFFNKFINIDDVDFWPTHRQLRPEDYGDDGEDEGDGCGDDRVDLHWVNLRTFVKNSTDWTDFEHALKESQKFGFYSYGEMCFIGFPCSPDPNDGYATNEDFQELIAIYHQDAKKTKRVKPSVDEDDADDDDKVHEGDHCFSVEDSGTVKQYTMIFSCEDSGWWHYKVIFDADGEQTDVYIENKDGITCQDDMKLFSHKDDGNKLRLGHGDHFEDENWVKLTLDKSVE